MLQRPSYSQLEFEDLDSVLSKKATLADAFQEYKADGAHLPFSAAVVSVVLFRCAQRFQS